MKIELNVEGAQLSDEVKDLLSNLTDEQKNQMALDMLSNVLKDSECKLRKSVAQEQALEDVRSKYKNEVFLDNGRIETPCGYVDYTVRNYFDERVRKHSDVANYFKDQVLHAMMKTAKEETSNMLRKSETVKKAISTATSTIEEQMPKIIHDAMVAYFATNMNKMMNTLSEAMMHYQNDSSLIQQMQQRLDAANI